MKSCVERPGRRSRTLFLRWGRRSDALQRCRLRRNTTCRVAGGGAFSRCRRGKLACVCGCGVSEFRRVGREVVSALCRRGVCYANGEEARECVSSASFCDVLHQVIVRAVQLGEP